MILLIDFGNTRTKYKLLSKNKDNSLMKTTAIENKLFNTAYLDKITRIDNTITQVVAASVANDKLIEQLSTYCRAYDINFTRVMSEASTPSVTSGYETPSQLGVDRWLAIIAGQKLFPHKNILIIDAGTATTIDLIDSSGQHRGGWIFAGVSLLLSSLLGNTEQVKADIKKEASLTFGLNTTDNVNNAAWSATVGLITQSIYQAEKDLGRIDKVIITGGNGKALTLLSNTEFVYVEDLVFYGLSEYSGKKK